PGPQGAAGHGVEPAHLVVRVVASGGAAGEGYQPVAAREGTGEAARAVPLDVVQLLAGLPAVGDARLLAAHDQGVTGEREAQVHVAVEEGTLRDLRLPDLLAAVEVDRRHLVALGAVGLAVLGHDDNSVAGRPLGADGADLVRE